MRYAQAYEDVQNAKRTTRGTVVDPVSEFGRRRRLYQDIHAVNYSETPLPLQGELHMLWPANSGGARRGPQTVSPAVPTGA